MDNMVNKLEQQSTELCKLPNHDVEGNPLARKYKLYYLSLATIQGFSKCSNYPVV